MYSQWIWNLKPLSLLVEFSVLWIFSYSVYHDENAISCTVFHSNCMFFGVQDQHLCLSLQKFYLNILQVFLTISLIMHFGLSGNCKEILLNDYHVKIFSCKCFPFPLEAQSWTWYINTPNHSVSFYCEYSGLMYKVETQIPTLVTNPELHYFRYILKSFLEYYQYYKLNHLDRPNRLNSLNEKLIFFSRNTN